MSIYKRRDNLGLAFAKKRLAAKKLFIIYAQLSRKQGKMETSFTAA